MLRGIAGRGRVAKGVELGGTGSRGGGEIMGCFRGGFWWETREEMGAARARDVWTRGPAEIEARAV